MDICGYFTRKQWLIVCALGSVNFACGMCISLQAPFFPREAESKGSTPLEYGLVFGVYELTAFISCPIYGKYMDKIGAKKIAIFGILLASISSMCFGLLDLVDFHTTFITLAFMVRILEALGTSAAITASYSITAAVFHESIATTFAILKGFFGFGNMFGPTVGGFIFESTGFIGPFMVVGCLLLFQACFVFAILPDMDEFSTKNEKRIQIFSVLRLLPVFLDLFSTFSAAISIGFILATLEPHIRKFGLTPVVIGAVFCINCGMYAISSPLVGYLCDTRIYPKKCVILGGVLIIAGFSLIGPAPYLPVDTVLWVVCIGLVLHGVGYAFILIPSFVDAIHSSVACGIPNDMALYGVIAGLAQAAFALGDCIGPSMSGLLFDTVGFRKGTLFVMATQVVMVVAMTTLVCVERQPAQKPQKIIAHSLTAGDCAEEADECSLIVSTNTKSNYGS